jgi:Zn-dependent protease with chaperone function
MAITYRDQRFSGFQEYIDRNAGPGPASADSTPLYAHPVDGWILHTLNATPIKAVMSRALDVYISFNFGHMLTSSLHIDRNSFPDLYEVLAHCAQTLNISIPHAVARQTRDLFNAYTAGTDEYHFIFISATLCEEYTRGEAAFVIGHECGHIAAGHMLYHNMVRILTQAASLRMGFIGYILRLTAGVPLMAWSRRSEVTADRAGLLCCGDIATAERALVRLVAGLADINRVDIEDYLRRSRSMEEFHSTGMINELMASHPMIARRVEALRMFANSELYYDLSGKPRPTDKVLLTRAELDRQVNEIVKP